MKLCKFCSSKIPLYKVGGISFCQQCGPKNCSKTASSFDSNDTADIFYAIYSDSNGVLNNGDDFTQPHHVYYNELNTLNNQPNGANNNNNTENTAVISGIESTSQPNTTTLTPRNGFVDFTPSSNTNGNNTNNGSHDQTTTTTGFSSCPFLNGEQSLTASTSIPIPASVNFCTKCGAFLDKSAKYCSHCQTRIQRNSNPKASSSSFDNEDSVGGSNSKNLKRSSTASTAQHLPRQPYKKSSFTYQNRNKTTTDENNNTLSSSQNNSDMTENLCTQFTLSSLHSNSSSYSNGTGSYSRNQSNVGSFSNSPMASGFSDNQYNYGTNIGLGNVGKLNHTAFSNSFERKDSTAERDVASCSNLDGLIQHYMPDDEGLPFVDRNGIEESLFQNQQVQPQQQPQQQQQHNQKQHHPLQKQHHPLQQQPQQQQQQQLLLHLQGQPNQQPLQQQQQQHHPLQQQPHQQQQQQFLSISQIIQYPGAIDLSNIYPSIADNNDVFMDHSQTKTHEHDTFCHQQTHNNFQQRQQLLQQQQQQQQHNQCQLPLQHNQHQPQPQLQQQQQQHQLQLQQQLQQQHNQQQLHQQQHVELLPTYYESKFNSNNQHHWSFGKLCKEEVCDESDTFNIEADQHGDTRLHVLIQEGQYREALQELNRVSVNKSVSRCHFLKYLNHRNKQGMVPLHSAVCRNPNNSDEEQKDLIDAMIKHGADINIKNRQGDNLIMIIIQVHEENEEKAFTLIKALTEASKGALQGLLNDPKEAFNTDGYAVIHLLVEKNLLRILRYLRKNAGLKLNIRDKKEKMTPMVLAARKRRWDTVKWLIKNGSCVNIPTSSSWYAVYAALEDANLDMLNLFMDKGVDIYGYKKITADVGITDTCDTYMRQRRRQFQPNGYPDRGKKKRRRCGCGDENSVVNS